MTIGVYDTERLLARERKAKIKEAGSFVLRNDPLLCSAHRYFRVVNIPYPKNFDRNSNFSTNI